MRTLTIIIVSILLVSPAMAQRVERAYGDPERARKSSHNTNRDLRNPSARLGYIEMGEDSVSLQEFMDNLEVGLTAFGLTNTRIVSYRIVILPRLQEVRSSEKIMGSRIPRKVFDELHMSELKPGDKIIFEDIKAELDDRRQRSMNAVKLKITGY